MLIKCCRQFDEVKKTFIMFHNFDAGIHEISFRKFTLDNDNPFISFMLSNPQRGKKFAKVMK